MGLFSQELSPAPLALSLDTAVGLALENSLALRKGFLDLDLSRQASRKLWAEIFPGISAGAGLSYGTRLFTGGGPQVDQNSMGYSLSFGLNLSLNGGLPSAMKIIELAYRSQLLSYENARRQLAVQVHKTFYNLIAERENLVLLAEMLDLAEKQLEKNRIAFGNGLIGELSYLRSRLSRETAKLNLSRAEAAYASALEEFLVLLGLEPQTGAVLEGSIEIAPIDADGEFLIREYLAARPDIQSQRRNIERLEEQKNRTSLSARAPSLSLSAQWRGSGAGGAELSDNLSGSLSLNIPIDSWIPGTKTEQSIQAALTELEKARLDLQMTETSAKTEIRSLVTSLRNSWNNIEISRLRVQIAERTYELTEDGFQRGAVEFLALEDTRNSMAEARQQLLTDELAYKTMMLDLAAALNIDPAELVRSLS
jgi:multidrug efflux system outer membrane protein